MLPFYRTWLAVRDLEVPTIAAVNGAAIGAGLALALACDLRYAAEDAKLGVPFTALGMHPGMATTYLLPEVAGLAVAREMLLTGRIVTGAEAARPGPGQPGGARARTCWPTALAAAEAVAAAAPVATRLTKAALLGGGHASFDAALEWEALAQPVTLATGGPAGGPGAPSGSAGRRGSPAAERPGTLPLARLRLPRRRPVRSYRRHDVATARWRHEAPGPHVRSARLPLASVPAGRPGGFVGRTLGAPARARQRPAGRRLWTGLWDGLGTAPGCRCGRPVDNLWTTLGMIIAKRR